MVPVEKIYCQAGSSSCKLVITPKDEGIYLWTTLTIDRKDRTYTLLTSSGTCWTLHTTSQDFAIP